MEPVERLLTAKREIRPAEGYWQDFLCEFRLRQRERTAGKSALGRAWLVVSDWLAAIGPTRSVYGLGFIYAAVTLGSIMTPRPPPFKMAPSKPVTHTVTEIPARGLQPALEELE